jgi:hypothetical protein
MSPQAIESPLDAGELSRLFGDHPDGSINDGKYPVLWLNRLLLLSTRTLLFG